MPRHPRAAGSGMCAPPIPAPEIHKRKHAVRVAIQIVCRALRQQDRTGRIGNVPLPLVTVGDLPRCAERQPLHGAALRPVALSVPGIYFQHPAHLCEDQIGKQPHARLCFLLIILCFCNSVNGFHRKLYRKRQIRTAFRIARGAKKPYNRDAMQTKSEVFPHEI